MHITLVTPDEWAEMVGLTRWREAKAGHPARNREHYWATEDRVTDHQNNHEVILEPADAMGEYKVVKSTNWPGLIE